MSVTPIARTVGSLTFGLTGGSNLLHMVMISVKLTSGAKWLKLNTNENSTHTRRVYDHDSGCWVEIQMCDMRVVKEEVLCELGAWED